MFTVDAGEPCDHEWCDPKPGGFSSGFDTIRKCLDARREFFGGFPISMGDLPAIVQLEDIKRQIVEAVECV